MSIVVVTRALRDQLLASKGEAELRDEAGNFIGRFLPAEIAVPELDITAEELARQLSPHVRTFSTAEVLAHVKGLTS